MESFGEKDNLICVRRNYSGATDLGDHLLEVKVNWVLLLDRNKQFNYIQANNVLHPK